MKDILNSVSLGLLVASVVTTDVSAFQHQVRLFGRCAAIRRSGEKKLAAHVNIDESAPRDIATMDQWVASCGVWRADGFELTSEDGVEVSAMTSVDLPAESPVLFVPNAMILSARQFTREFGRVEAAEERLASASATEHVPNFYLFLKILKEFERGDRSPWYPWLNALPRYYSNGASMTPFCFDCLPPLAGNLAMGERIRFVQFFRALRCVDSIGDEVKNSEEAARWAFAVARTRGHPAPDGDFGIAPMADMLDHGTEAEVRLSYDGEGNLEARATRDVPAGSPLRLSYGDPTNPSLLLARYGFLDESSPATFCKIMIPRPEQKLIDMGYSHSRMLFFKDTGEISEEVWDVLLYQILISDPAARQAFYDAHTNGDYNSKQAMHQKYFEQTSVALNNHVNTFLKDLENLQRKGDGIDIREHPRFPIIMQHNEHVKETFLKVRDRLARY